MSTSSHELKEIRFGGYFITWILWFCIVLHMSLSVPIWIAKYRMNSKEPKQKGMTFGSFLTTWIFWILMGLFVASLLFMNNIEHPRKLREFPNNLIVVMNHVVFPVSFSIIFSAMFYRKNKALQKHLKVWKCGRRKVTFC